MSDVRKYRKRPVVVEAIRYEPGVNCREVEDFTGIPHNEADCYDDAEYGIETLEGLMWANAGDYIIKGVVGEFYPCKSDIFDATYELADTREGPDNE